MVLKLPAFLDVDRAKRLTPGWFAAIAGAAVAGATLVPDHKIIAGLGAGIGMLAIALKLTPCCDGCAAGQGCGDAKPTTIAVGEPSPVSTGGLDDPKRPFDGTPIIVQPTQSAAPSMADVGCVGCKGGVLPATTSPTNPKPPTNPWDGTGITAMTWEYS